MPWPDGSRPLHSSRQHSWDGLKTRILNPVGMVNRPNLLLRRMSRTSAESTTKDGTPDGGIDDIYFGGELPEDPFGREPVTVTLRPRFSPTTRLCEPTCAPTQPSPEPIDFPIMYSDLSSKEDKDMDDTRTITLRPLSPRDDERASKCNSSFSEESFHTCPSLDSAISTEDDPTLAMLHQYESTPYGEWPEIDTSPARHFLESLREVSYEEEQHVSTEILRDLNSPCFPDDAPCSLEASATQFALTASEDLSPLSITAASIACDRRYCMSVCWFIMSLLLTRLSSSMFSPTRKVFACSIIREEDNGVAQDRLLLVDDGFLTSAWLQE